MLYFLNLPNVICQLNFNKNKTNEKQPTTTKINIQKAQTLPRYKPSLVVHAPSQQLSGIWNTHEGADFPGLEIRLQTNIVL